MILKKPKEFMNAVEVKGFKTDPKSETILVDDDKAYKLIKLGFKPVEGTQEPKPDITEGTQEPDKNSNPKLDTADVKIFKCDKCGKTFTKKQALSAHMRYCNG